MSSLVKRLGSRLFIYRIASLRKLRLSQLLPRRVTAFFTALFLPVDPKDLSEGSACRYPVRRVRYWGLDYELDLNEHIDFNSYFDGFYDFRAVKFMYNVVARIHRPIYMDVGANVGNHLLPLTRQVERILAFEPNPPMAEKLRQNLTRNKINNVEVFEFGLGAREENLLFFSNTRNPGAGSFVKGLPGRQPDSYLSIRVGDEVIQGLGLPRLDLLKIDVEGFEFEVLRGLAKTLERFRPLVLFEYVMSTTQSKLESPRALYNTFPDGYQICALSSSTRSRYFGDSAYDRPKLFLSNRNYSNVLAFPQEKYSVAFGDGGRTRLVE